MADAAHQDELPVVRAEDAVVSPPAIQALPRILSAEAAVRMVQHYVQEERRRNRRMLLWTTLTFVLVILGAAAVFATLGVTVLRRTRQTAHLVNEMQSRTDSYAAEVAGVVQRIREAEKSSQLARDILEKREAARINETRQLKTDLEKFARWVAARTTGGGVATTPLETRLRELEAQVEKNIRELEELKKRYGAPGNLPAIAASETSYTGDVFVAAATQGTTVGGPAGDTAALPPELTPESVRKLFDSMDNVTGARRTPQGAITTLTFPNGDRYEGSVKDGLLHGWGIYYYHNGDRYEGEFRNDSREGMGTLFFHNGDHYQGEFQNDQINGKGRMFYHDGTRYAGDFRNGLRHGNGVLWFRNGDIYQGEFREDIRTGRGVYIFSNGGKYIGEFQDGKRHGEGRYIYPGGEEYVGSFKNGLKDGIGESVYPDGRRMRGLWKEDQFVKWLD